MARTVETGVTINATDNASAVVTKASKTVQQSFSTASRAVISWNQALSLTRKTLRILELGIQATIGKSLELRSGFDLGKRALFDFGKDVEKLQAELGNILVPLLVAFAEAFGPIITATTMWLKNNRELISTGLADWIVGIGNFLNTVLTPAIKYLTVVWNYWATIVRIVQLIATKFFEKISEAVGFVIGKVRLLAQWFQDLPFADKFGEAAEEVAEFAKGLVESVDVSSYLPAAVREIWAEVKQGVDDTVSAWASMDAASAAITTGLLAFKKNTKEAGSATVSTNKELLHTLSILRSIQTVAEREKMLTDLVLDLKEKNLTRVAEVEQKFWDQHNALFDQGVEAEAYRIGELTDTFAQAEAYKTLAAKVESEARLARAERDFEREKQLKQQAVQLDRQRVQSLKATADKMTDFFFALGAAAAKGGDEAAEAIKGIFTSLLLEMAKVAASKIFFAILSLISGGVGGFLGDALGFLFGGADGGLVKAANGGLVQTFAGGGPVYGGTPGQDSVPALLMPGEYVIPANQVRENVRSGRAPDDSGRAGGGGGSVTVNVNAGFAPSRSQIQDVTNRAIAPSVRRAIRTRRYDPLG